MADSERMTLKIGGQEFTLLVKPEEHDDVLAAIQLVEDQMKENAKRGASGPQKQAVMTAFHLAFEKVQAARDPLSEKKTRGDLERRVDAMIQSIDKALEAKA